MPLAEDNGMLNRADTSIAEHGVTFFNRKHSFMTLVAMIFVVMSTPRTASAQPMGGEIGERRCATLEALALARERGDRVIFEQDRPESVGFIDSDVIPVRVHWQAEPFEDRAPVALALVEDAWNEQVVAQGYRAPLADMGEGGDARLDVYLVNTPGIAGLTLASADVDDDDGAHAAYVHLLLNATLSEDELAVTVAHEFAHAIHYATDRSETLMFFEASATWQEVHANPASTLWVDNVEAFQSFPNAPVYTNGIDWRAVVFEDVLYEYGAVLFLMYLEEEFGENDGALLRELWEGSVQADAVEENAPDWWDALKSESEGGDPASLAAFAQWRTLVGSWRKSGEGPELAEALGGRAEVAPKRLLPQALNGRPVRFLPSELPFATGCAWVATTAPGNRAVELEIEAFSEDGRPLSLVGLRGFPPGDVDVIDWPLTPTSHPEYALTLGEGETLRLGACDVASETDADVVGGALPLVLTIYDTSLPPPEVDAGVGTEDAGTVDGGTQEPEPPPTCGCQAARRAPLPGGGPWGKLKPYFFAGGILAAAYMFFVRFRRSARARKSMKGSNWKAQRDAIAKKSEANKDETKA